MVEPAALTASVGCQVILSCLDGEGPPLQLFQWSFNAAPLQATPQAVVRGNGELVLSSVRVEDSGNYSCTVFGDVGETTATAVLTVEDPVFSSGVPSAPPIIISPTPPNQQLSLWQALQFVCLVEGFPQPEIMWLKDGNPLPNIRRLTDLGESLSLRDVRVTDAGVYMCVATNPLGQDSMQFTVNITC